MQRTLISSLAMVAALMSVGNGVFAHDDARSRQNSVAPNGGQLRMAGSYHFELVVAKDSKEAKDNPVTVYLTDHGDKKVPAAGATGTATILAAKSKITVPLAPFNVKVAYATHESPLPPRGGGVGGEGNGHDFHDRGCLEKS
jgi:hypothetical protein